MQAYGSFIHRILKLCTTVLSVNSLSPCMARLFLYKWLMRFSSAGHMYIVKWSLFRMLYVVFVEITDAGKCENCCMSLGVWF